MSKRAITVTVAHHRQTRRSQELTTDNRTCTLTKRLIRLGLLVCLTSLSIGSLTSCGSAHWKMANTALDFTDPEQPVGIRRIAVVAGTSRVYDKKTNDYYLAVLPYSNRFRQVLITRLSDDAASGPAVVPAFDTANNSVALEDPFYLLSRKEAKRLFRSDPQEATMTFESRSWDECPDCAGLADSLQVDALWVVWARWFSNESDLSKMQYSNKEKGWLHVSTHLYSVADGKLLAWSSLNRTGIGIWPFFNWGKAYDYAAGAVAKGWRRTR